MQSARLQCQQNDYPYMLDLLAAFSIVERYRIFLHTKSVYLGFRDSVGKRYDDLVTGSRASTSFDTKGSPESNADQFASTSGLGLPRSG